MVWLREPNACAEVHFYHFTKDSLNNTGFPSISRMIRIPNVSDAILGTPMGIHFVNSGQDFSFKITPIGENAGKTPVVKTGRISLPDKEGVYIQNNGDGSFTVHIYRVREPLELDISFKSNNSNGNAFGLLFFYLSK